jgi:hypothetical protein
MVHDHRHDPTARPPSTDLKPLFTRLLAVYGPPDDNTAGFQTVTGGPQGLSRLLLAIGRLPSGDVGSDGEPAEQRFLKIMRAPVQVRYVIEALPEVAEVLSFLAAALELGHAEAYETLNMGAGFVAVVAEDDVEETLPVARRTGHEAILAGRVEAGARSLTIPSLGVEYVDEGLQLG